MKDRFSIQLSEAFVVDERSLKKIFDSINNQVGNVSIDADCCDDVKRQFNSFDELMNYENTLQSRILELKLRSSTKNFSGSASVRFSARWYFKGIFISIDGDDKFVTLLRREILDVISGLRPWYNVLHKIDIFWLMLITYTIVNLYALIYVASINVTYTSREISVSESARSKLIGIAINVFFVGFAYGLHRFRKLLFPFGSFKIGQEIQRFETMEKFRWGVVMAVVASLAASLIWSLASIPFQK